MTDHSEKPPRHIGCDDHDACEGGPCKQAEKPWEPSMPLRSEADNNQIGERFIVLIGDFYRRVPEAEASGALNVTIEVARELASAVSLEKEAKCDRDCQIIAETCMAELAEKDAEIARLRAELKDATYGMTPDPRMSS